MHVELRYCDGLTLCPCGVHIQYRKDIYMYHACGGRLIDGFVYGNGESIILYQYSPKEFYATVNHVSSCCVYKYISKLHEYHLFDITIIFLSWLIFPKNVLYQKLTYTIFGHDL